MNFNSREEVIVAMQDGRMALVTDDIAEHREHDDPNTMRPDCHLCREAAESAKKLRAQCWPRSAYGN